MAPAKCPKCSSTDVRRSKSGGMVPPGHPIFSLVVGAAKVGQMAGVFPCYYNCNNCSHLFTYAFGISN